jgi:inner membrane protein
MADAASSELLWFGVGLVLLLLELALPGFIIMFFGIGAWVVAIGIWTGVLDSFNTEIVVFLASSLLTLALFRKKGRKLFEGKVTGRLAEGASIDDIKGSRAIVVSPLEPNRLGGKVEFHGTLWDASSDVPVAKGDVVEIIDRENLRLKVKPLA